MTLNSITTQYDKLFICTDDAYRYMGAHLLDNGDYVFSLYAPNAKKVCLFGDFNGWRQDDICLTRRDNGVWYCVVRAKEYDQYKFIIDTAKGERLYKADPFARYSQTKGQTNSIIFNGNYVFNDDNFIHNRQSRYDKQLNIYEVHLGSWRLDGLFDQCERADEPLYRAIALPLAEYAKQGSYTHIELMPLTEYPLDDSWGYQATGYFSPTSRYGTPDDLRYLIDTLHQNGIGVILDWVPAHFCKDDFGLCRFDGSYLFESDDPLRREHTEWGTCIFDLSKPFVTTFLLSSARYFAEQFHFDGFRVDAVASMLYLDYARKDGQWRLNKYGENINLEAVDFFRVLSKSVFAFNPSALLIAEESTAFYGVTMPADKGGLGFNYKWNMGWMNDVLTYFSTDFANRDKFYRNLTFPMTYAYSENYILPFSHDEVVHGKRSLIEKMPGSYEQKFNGLKQLFALLYSYSGKKLTFMGSEFAQFIEWNFAKQLDWLLLGYAKHAEFAEFTRKLCAFYANTPAFYEQDCNYHGFDFIQADDFSGVLAYFRVARNGEKIFCLFNFSDTGRQKYRLRLPKGKYHCVFSQFANKDFAVAINRPKSLTFGAQSYAFYTYTPLEDKREGSQLTKTHNQE